MTKYVDLTKNNLYKKILIWKQFPETRVQIMHSRHFHVVLDDIISCAIFRIYQFFIPKYIELRKQFRWWSKYVCLSKMASLISYKVHQQFSIPIPFVLRFLCQNLLVVLEGTAVKLDGNTSYKRDRFPHYPFCSVFPFQ